MGEWENGTLGEKPVPGQLYLAHVQRGANTCRCRIKAARSSSCFTWDSFNLQAIALEYFQCLHNTLKITAFHKYKESSLFQNVLTTNLLPYTSSNIS